MVDDHASKASAPPSVGHTYVVGGARTVIDPATRTVTSITPISQLLAFDTTSLRFYDITVTKGAENAVGAVRGAATAFLFNANDRTNSDGTRNPRPALAVYGGIDSGGNTVNDVRVLYLGTGTTPDINNAEWVTPGALKLPGQSAGKAAYAAMAATAYGDGAVVMGGYDDTGAVTANTWILTSEVPPPQPVAEGEAEPASTIPMLNVARGRTPKVSSTPSTYSGPEYLVDGSESTSWYSSTEDNPWVTLDIGAPVPVSDMRLVLYYYASTYRQQMETALFHVSSAAKIGDIWKSGQTTYNCSSDWKDATDDRYMSVDCDAGATGQYVHITIPGRARWFYYLYEIEVNTPLDWRWKEVPQIEAMPQSQLEGLSYYSTYYSPRGVDGDTNTYVYGYSSTASLAYRVELPAVKKVVEVDLWKPDYCSTTCVGSFRQSTVYVSNADTWAKVDKIKDKCITPGVNDWFTSGKQNQAADCELREGSYVWFVTAVSAYTSSRAYMYLGELYVKVSKAGFPTPRARSAATQFRGHAFFYGGVGNQGQVVDELSVFDTRNSLFVDSSAIAAIGTAPPGRSRLSFVQLSGNRVGFFGGLDFSGSRGRDFWTLLFDDCAALPTERFIASRDDYFGVTYYNCQASTTNPNGNNPVLCGIDGRLNGAVPVCLGPRPTKPLDVRVAPGSVDFSVDVTWKPPAEYNTVASRNELISYYIRPSIVGEFEELFDGTATTTAASKSLLEKRGWQVLNDPDNKLALAMTGTQTDVTVSRITGCTATYLTSTASCPMLMWTGARADPFAQGMSINWKYSVEFKDSNSLVNQNTWLGIWLTDKTGGFKSNNWDLAIGAERTRDYTYGSSTNRYTYGYTRPRMLGIRPGQTRPTTVASFSYDLNFGYYKYLRSGYDYIKYSDYKADWEFVCEMQLAANPPMLKCFYNAVATRRYRYCYNSACSSSSTWYGPYLSTYTNQWIGSSAGYSIADYLPTSEDAVIDPAVGLIFSNPQTAAHKISMTSLEIAADSCTPAIAPLPAVLAPVSNTSTSYSLQVPGVPRDTNVSFRVLAANDMGYGEESDPSGESPAKPGPPLQASGVKLDPSGFQVTTRPSGSSSTWRPEQLFDGLSTFPYLFFSRPNPYPVYMTVDMGATQVVTDVEVWVFSDYYMKNSEWYISPSANPYDSSRQQCKGPTFWPSNQKQLVPCNNARGRYLHVAIKYYSGTSLYIVFRDIAIYGLPSPDNCPVRPTRAGGAIVPAYMSASTDCSTGKPGSVCLLNCQASGSQSYYPISGVSGASCVKGSWDGPERVCGQYCSPLPAVQGLRQCTESLLRRTFSNPGSTNNIALRTGDFMYFEQTDGSFPVAAYWSIVSGKLATSGLLRDSCTKDYGVSVIFPDVDLENNRRAMTLMTVFQTEGAAGVLFRWRDASNYMVAVVNVAQQKWYAKAIVGGVSTEVASGTLRYPLGAFADHTLEIDMDGPSFTLYIDGTIEGQFESSDLQAGYVGLVSMFKAVTFDAIVVTGDCTGTGCGSGSIEDTCAFTCAAGYNQVGPAVTYCQGTYPATPSWTNSDISCSLIPPSVGNYTLQVHENSAKDTAIGPDVIAAVIEAADQQVAYGVDKVYRVLPSGALELMDTQSQRIFTIDVCSGQMSVNLPVLDYEAQSVYVVTVRAYVAGDASAFSISHVTIDILDVNENPVVSDQSLFIHEIAEGPVRIYGASSQRRNETDATLSPGGVAVVDPERDAVEYQIVPSGNALADGLFTINPITGFISTSRPNVTELVMRGQLNFEGVNQFILNVRVVETSTPEKLSGQGSVTVVALDQNDFPDIRASGDSISPWGQSTIVVTVKDTTVEAAPSAWQTAKFAPALTIIDEDIINGTFGERPMTVSIDTNIAAIDITETLRRYETSTDDALAAALFSNAVNSSLWFPTVDGTVSGTALFNIDPATRQIGFATDPAPGASGTPTGEYSERDQFFFRGKLTRQAYAVPVKASDGYGGVITINVVALVEGDPATNPYVESIGTAPSFNDSAPLPTQGGLEVRFTGNNIAVGASVKALIGRLNPSNPTTTERIVVDDGSGTACSVAVANEIRCTSPAGSGTGWLWELQVEITPGSGTYKPVTFLVLTAVSFEAPTVTAIAGNTDMRTTGSARITLTGTNLGAVDRPRSFRFGCKLRDDTGVLLTSPVCAFGCRISGSSAHTSFQCFTDPAAGADLDWIYTVDGQSVTSDGRPNDRLAHAAPEVYANTGFLAEYYLGVTTPSYIGTRNTNTDGYTIDTLDTSGGQDILIQGSNFGPTGTAIQVKFGNSDASVGDLINCRQGTGYSSHSSITCESIPFAGRFHAIQVVVAGVSMVGVTNATTQALGYLPPVVTDVSGPGAFGSPTPGGGNVYITGRHFGPISATAVLIDSVYYGPPANPNRFRAAGCVVVSEPPSASQILCQTAPGTGRNHSWTVAIATQTTAPFAAATYYAAPIIASFSGAGSFDADTDGNQVVTISGSNFGPGGSQYTYGDAGVFEVKYTVKLDDFAPVNGELVPVFDFVPTSCTIQSHESIQCTTNDGAGDRLAWNIVIDEQVSTEPVTDYGPPKVSQIIVHTGATRSSPVLANIQACSPAGGQYVEIIGTNFGPSNVAFSQGRGDFLQSVRYGPTGTEYAPQFALVGRGHTRLYFITEPGSGSNLRVSVKVGDQASGPSSATFGYAPPTVLSVTPNTASTYSNPENPTIVGLEVQDAPLYDALSDIVVVFGNSDFQAVLRPRSPRQLANGNALIEFSLPTNGGGVNIPVRVGTVPAKAPVTALKLDPLGNAPGVSPATAVSMFSYKDPVVNRAVNLRPFFRLSINATQDCQDALFNSPYSSQPPTDSSVFDCGNQDIRQIELSGENFGAAPSSLERSDGLQRFLEANVPNPVTGTPSWVREPVVIYSWTHNKIVFFTTITVGTVRVRLVSQSYNLDTDTIESSEQSVSVAYQNSNPDFGALQSGTDLTSVPTTGGEATLDKAILLEATDLDTSTPIVVYVAGVPATLLNPTTGIPLSKPPSDPNDRTSQQWQNYESDVRAQILANTFTRTNPSGPDTTYWKVYVVIPAGQGASVEVYLDKGSLSSKSVTFSYARPAINTFAVVKGGAESPQQDALRTTARVPTDGTAKIRVYGTNLGPCPSVRINYFDSMYPADSYTVGSDDTVNCLAYQKNARDEYKSKVRPCSNTEGLHTCYEFDTFEGEGDGTQLGLASGFTIDLVTEGAAEGDAGFVSTPAEFRMSYESAVISAVAALTAGGFPTEGGAPIRITGNNFGKYPSALAFNATQDVSIMFGTVATGFNLPCINVNRESHTSVTCTIPEGSGRDLFVKATVAGLTGTSAAGVLSYTPPSISAMSIVQDGVVTRSVNASTVSGGGSFVIGGPTTGGYSLVLDGVNFGVESEFYHCTFLSWSSRSANTFSCGLNAADRSMDAFIGQGKIATSGVVAHSHRRIEIIVPEGVGSKDVVVYVRGNMLTAAPGGGGGFPRFVYDAPVFTADITPRTAPTVGGQVLTLVGRNFGPTPRYSNSSTGIPLAIASSIPVYLMRVQLSYPGCLNAPGVKCPCITNARRVTGAGRPGRVEDCIADTTLSHTHTEIKFAIPAGIGLDRQVNVELLDAAASLEDEQVFLPAADFKTATSTLFSYDAPIIDLTNPQTVRMHGVSDAGSEQIRAVDLIGRNFGNIDLADAQGWTDEERELEATVANIGCDDITRRREDGETVIRCAMRPTYVGFKNISVHVAGQDGFRDVVPKTRALHAVCDNDWFGRPGQVCLPCPRGATCLGYVAEIELPAAVAAASPTQAELAKHTMPVPQAGWFNLNSSDSLVADDMSGACPPNFIIDDRDVCVAPCSPASSCIGENFCAVGYRSAAPEYRCSSCAIGYYKRAGLCAECPDSPELLIIAFVLMAICAAVAAYFLNKSNIDVALVQIGIDYFQVLAIFSSARIKWPAIIRDIFHIMSAFNLNLEITAPECLVPDIAFVTKWLIIMAIPLGCAFMLFVAWAVGVLYNRASRGGSWKEINAHAGRIVAGYMIMLYFLYLYISKQILDIFNCSPTDPPDGKLYLQAVFEPCDKPGGVYETLLVPAIIALGVYTVGFPLFCLYITCTKKRRETIMLDQLLRCYGVGFTLGRESTVAQRRAFEFRKAYNRLYYAFRPEFYYWILLLLARKFLIALASLMFADAADFQMAFVLLVLFISYTMQVYFRPYLSRDEFKKTAEEWRAQAEAGKRDPTARALHYEIQSAFDDIARVSTDLERALNIDRVAGAGASLSSAATAGRGSKSAMDLLGSTFKNLMNYNTVATFLLASSILVCLAGIMFESGRLDRDGSEASRDAVTGVALAFIFVTLIYFMVVFAGEMLLVCNARMCVRAAKTGKEDKDEEPLNKDVSVTVKSTTANPMMRQQALGEDEDGSHALKAAEEAYRMDMKMLGDKPPQDADQWREFKMRFEEQSKQVHQLNESIAALRRDKASASVAAGAAGSFGRAPGSPRPLSRRGSFKAKQAGGGSSRKNILKK